MSKDQDNNGDLSIASPPIDICMRSLAPMVVNQLKTDYMLH